MAQTLSVKKTQRVGNNQDFVASLLASEDDRAELLDNAPMDRLNILASQLIARRQRQNVPIRIDVSGLPHEALVSFAEELEKLGISYDLSSDLVNAVKEYWIRRGASFTRAVKAKPIWIVLDVTDRKPEKTFRNGLADVVALTGAARVGEFATTVTRTLAYGGGGTTSNAGADRVFDAVWGKMSVWLMTESPSRQDLDGLDALGAALTGIAGMAGGGLSAKEIQDIIQQVLKESGPEGLSPDAIALIDAIMQLKEAASAPEINPEVIAQLSHDISQLTQSPDIPPALMQAVTAALTTLGGTPALSAILMQNGLAPLMAQNDNIALSEHIAEIVKQLQSLSEKEGIDDALKGDIEKIIQQLQESLAQEGAQPEKILATLQTQLIDMAARENLPAPVFAELSNILPAVADAQTQATIIAELGIENTARTLTEQVADIAAKIEAGVLNLTELPPEIQNLIESLGGIEHLQTTLSQETGLSELRTTITEGLKNSMAMPELTQAIQSAAPLLSTLSDTSSANIATDIATQMQNIAAKIEAGVLNPSELPLSVQNWIQSIGGVNHLQTMLGQEGIKPDVMRVIAEAMHNTSSASAITIPTTIAATTAAPSTEPKRSETSTPTQSPTIHENGAMVAKVVPTPTSAPQVAPAQKAASPGQPQSVKPDVVLPPHIQSTLKSVIQEISKGTTGTHPLPASMKVVLQSLKPLENLIQTVQQGKTVTGTMVNQTLKALDTALSKAVPPALRESITNMRNSIAEAAKKVTGVDKLLKAEPGKGNCPPPCKCISGKFKEAAKSSMAFFTRDSSYRFQVSTDLIKRSTETAKRLFANYNISTDSNVSKTEHEAMRAAFQGSIKDRLVSLRDSFRAFSLWRNKGDSIKNTSLRVDPPAPSDDGANWESGPSGP